MKDEFAHVEVRSQSMVMYHPLLYCPNIILSYSIALLTKTLWKIVIASINAYFINLKNQKDISKIYSLDFVPICSIDVGVLFSVRVNFKNLSGAGAHLPEFLCLENPFSARRGS